MSKNLIIDGKTYEGVTALKATDADSSEIAVFPDTSDATAIASDIALNKTAYVKGYKVYGTNTGVLENDLDGLVDGTIVDFIMPTGKTNILLYRFYQFINLTSANLGGANTVGQYAFYNCFYIRSLTLPKSLRNIAEYAFYNVGRHTQNTFTLETNYWCTIGNYAFQYARLLSVKGVYAKIGEYAFADSPTLAEVNITRCRDMSAYAFYNNTALKTLAINIYGAIGNYAFANLYSVREATIGPESVITGIGNYAFSGFGGNRANADTNIITMDFRNSTFANISTYSFGTTSTSYRNKYMKILFPNTLSTISAYAFGYTDNCEFYFENFTPPTLSATTAWNNATNYKILVPYDRVEAYMKATNWTAQAEYIRGFSASNSFEEGAALPEFSSEGYGLTWYSDSACTQQVTTVADASAMYYCVVGTEKLAYCIKTIRAFDCTVTVTDGTKYYVEGDFVNINTLLTISAMSTVSGYVLEDFSVNGNSFTSGDTYTMSKDLNVVVRYYDGISVPVYGVSGEGAASPALTRTDDAIGLGYTIGTTEIQSDFDKCYPWSNMTEFTDSYGNKFVLVPKFYTQYTFDEDGLKTTRISKKPQDDTWKLNPIFIDANGNELDYFCIGKYDAGLDNSYRLTSVSGVSPKTYATRASIRAWAKNCGTGYQQLDIWAVVALQDLFKIEFATLNSQSIMYGLVNPVTSPYISGLTDSIATPSGSPPSAYKGWSPMKYREIENLYGNVFQWVDGINTNNYQSYVCYNPSNYADDTATNYTMLSYQNSARAGQINKLGYDENNPFVHMPVVTNSGLDNYCDHYYCADGWRVCYFGGAMWSSDSTSGIFFYGLGVPASNGGQFTGGRLLYRPL